MEEMQETRVRSLDWEDPLEQEVTIHSSVFPWEIPWTVEPGRLQSMGSQRARHDSAHTEYSHQGTSLGPTFSFLLSQTRTEFTLNLGRVQGVQTEHRQVPDQFSSNHIVLFD